MSRRGAGVLPARQGLSIAAKHGQARRLPHLLLPHLLEVKHAPLVGDDHVEQAVGVHVVDLELRADAAVGVEDVLRPLRASFAFSRASSYQAISGGSSSPGSRPLWA